MTAAPLPNLVELTVSELSVALRRTIEDIYGYVRVRGEVSGFRGVHASGHVYFALKDEAARIDAVIWRTALRGMRIKPEDGLEVIVTGRLTTYPGRSSYQIIVEHLAPAGVGALMALLEERKRKLTAEGLFDTTRKRPLPFLPRLIGVVTSPSGAVIRDILHRLADRFPRPVLVWPVRVQGDGAAEQIARAIRGFNDLSVWGAVPRPDLLIIARGGGSLEDLWPFNEEIVVRAAADSLIPLISAVGHETDVTLIDFAADRRAPTPSAAAEMAVPVRSELLSALHSLARRGLACWRRALEMRRAELRSLLRTWPSAELLLALPAQRLERASERLPRALKANAQIHLTLYSRIAGRLTPLMLQTRIIRERERIAAGCERTRRAASILGERRRERLAGLAVRLTASLRANRQAHRQSLARDHERLIALFDRATRAILTGLHRRQAGAARAGQVLLALSYQGVLARGFALVRDAQGKPLRTAAAVRPGRLVDLEFADGHVAARAEAPRVAAATPNRRRPSRTGSDVIQGNLFGGEI